MCSEVHYDLSNGLHYENAGLAQHILVNKNNVLYKQIKEQKPYNYDHCH